MMRDIDEIQRQLAPVFAAYDIRRAVLFGSFAKGCAREDSDLDLLVESDLRGLRFVGFSEAVRSAAGRPCDVFDLTHIEADSPIEREIAATGVIIYEG